MNFKIEKSMIILKRRLLKNENFSNLFCNSICALFSFEIDVPRILISDENKFFQKIITKLQKNCEICLKNGQNYENFCLCVHLCEFDLGLFVEEKNENIFVKLVSGSGLDLSQTKVSIIEKMFEVERNMRKVEFKKIDVQQKMSEEFCKFVHSQQMEKLKNML